MTQRKHRQATFLLYGCSLLVLLTPCARSVSQTSATVSIPRFGTYEGSHDTVNVGSLEVTMTLPLYTKHSRGGALNQIVELQYNSKANVIPVRYTTVTSGAITYDSPNWSVVTGDGSEALAYFTDTEKPCGKGYRDYYQYYFLDTRGITHSFPGGFFSDCSIYSAAFPASSPLANVSAADGSGVVLTNASYGNGYVQSVSGIKYQISQSTNSLRTVTDTNGNSLVADTMRGDPCGTTPTPQPATSGSNPLVSGGCILNTGQKAPVYVSYLDTNGSAQYVTVDFELINVSYPYGNSVPSNPCSGVTTTPCYYSEPVVSSVVYPDGSGYIFNYENNGNGGYSGRLSSLVLPGGGTISYLYSNETLYGDHSIDSLSRTTSDGTVTYTRAVLDTGGNGAQTLKSTTTIKYPDGHTEVANNVHDSLPPSGTTYNGYGGYYETGRTVYAASSSSSVIQSETRCYNGVTSNCNTQTIFVPITEIVHTVTSAGLTKGDTYFYNSAGVVTEKDEYDYSGLARKTVTSYASLGNNIQNRPSVVTVYDGSGNVLRKTTFAYDEYSLASSGVTGLSSVTGARGNLTTRTSSITSSSTVITHNHYDDAGQVVSSTDGRNNTTLYAYDSTDTYLTKKTLPAVPAGTFSESYAVDDDTGLVTKSTDINGNSTSNTYDSMLRLVGTCYPDQGYKKTAYLTTTQMAVSVLVGSGSGCVAGGSAPSGTWSTSTYNYDGYGRIEQIIDAGGSIVDTTYDSMGRVYGSSNPHFSATSSTDGTTYMYYDQLGRMNMRKYQDGSIEYWCYNGLTTTSASSSVCHSHLGAISGSWVDYQDPRGNQWQRTTDGLGRLTEVMEPNGASTAASMETDYTYSALDNLISVAQWGGSSGNAGVRARSFSYDYMSRLVQSYNSETGWVCYGSVSSGTVPSGSNCTEGYDANGNLASKVDARGIKITYAYDAWNRLTDKSYSDSTPSAHYNYDETTASVGSGSNANISVIIANGAGRVTSQYAGKSSTGVGIAVKSFSYDAMGRVIGSSECWGTTECALKNGTVKVRWTYDLAGNIISLDNSTSRIFNYTYDSANHLQTVSNSFSLNGSSSATVVPMITGMAYFPGGLTRTMTTDTGTATVGGTWGYDSRMRVTSYANLSTANSGFTEYGYSLAYDADSNIRTSNESVYIPGSGAESWSWTNGYDSLSRLTTAVSSGTLLWGCQYTYDAFGNRLDQEPYGGSGYSCTSAGTPVNADTNRLAGFSYDSAGGMTYDGKNSLTYDAEGRIASSADSNGTTTYIYGADGLRVGKVSGGVEANYVRNLDGSLLATYMNGSYYTQPQELWVSGVHFGTATVSSDGTAQSINFSLANWLGSEAARTNPVNGSIVAAFAAQPFGDAQTNLYGSDTDDIHYTGKERDTESGNDYFQARYYRSSLGRFMSPDWSVKVEPIPYAKMDDPQSLNLYAYVGNNPTGRRDSDGHYEDRYRVGGDGWGSWAWSDSNIGDAPHPESKNPQANPPLSASDDSLDQQQSLALFPTNVQVDPGSVSVDWRLRTSNGKNKPGQNYLVFEHLDHCGAQGTVCQSNGTAIGPVPSYGADHPGYSGNDPNVFRDGYGGTKGGNTIQSFTIQLMKGSRDLTYDSSRQKSVTIHYGNGTVWGSQGVYHGPGGRATVFVNGYTHIPEVPRISGEY